MATAAPPLNAVPLAYRAGLGALARPGDGSRLQTVAGVPGSSVAPGGAAVPVLDDRVLLAAGLAPDRCLRREGCVVVRCLSCEQTGKRRPAVRQLQR
jgi:hypothetical protein